MALQDPIHAHTNAAGVVKSNPLKVKKEGYGKGSWGSAKDEFRDARDLVDELPPAADAEREVSMRKVCTVLPPNPSFHTY
jgi:hypothetical protein